jgi:hypothetical protein
MSVPTVAGVPAGVSLLMKCASGVAPRLFGVTLTGGSVMSLPPFASAKLPCA